MLKEFYYDGKGGKGIHFYVGRGPQPSSKGTVVPNELGYMEPLRRYHKEDIKLQLPGEWFALYFCNFHSETDKCHKISKRNCGVLNSSEKQWNNFPHCCPRMDD